MLQEDLTRTVINPMYKKDVIDLTQGRHNWRKAGNCAEGVSKILFGVSIMLSFSAGYYDKRDIMYLSGMFNTLALILLSLSSYFMKESSERTSELNIVLTRLHMEKVDDIAIDSSGAELKMAGQAVDEKSVDPDVLMHI